MEGSRPTALHSKIFDDAVFPGFRKAQLAVLGPTQWLQSSQKLLQDTKLPELRRLLMVHPARQDPSLD
jgi:hypothetical protein